MPEVLVEAQEPILGYTSTPLQLPPLKINRWQKGKFEQKSHNVDKTQMETEYTVF